MKAKEWRAHDPAELDFQLKELQKRLFDLRFKSASEEISDTKELRRIKRDIARILTIKRERVGPAVGRATAAASAAATDKQEVEE